MNRKQSVLIVDDDETIRELIQLYLEDDFEVIHAVDGSEAVNKAKTEKPALILLDIMLPEKSGWEVCKEIRTFSQIPIIMVSAKGEEIDKILGLELGADDYICKPFSPRELLARAKAQIRRSLVSIDSNVPNLQGAGTPSMLLKFKGLEIDLKAYKVTSQGQNVELTAKEFDLLAFLAKHKGQVFSRDKLLNEIWGFDFLGDSRAVDSAIKRLRKKLSTEGGNDYVHTIWGVGYKFEVT